MAQTTAPEVRVDSHSIEPIPGYDRDSTGWQQAWIAPGPFCCLAIARPRLPMTT